jgi:flagellar hook-length control protein FliK
LFAAERTNQSGFELVFVNAQRKESIRVAENTPPRHERRQPIATATQTAQPADPTRNARPGRETRSPIQQSAEPHEPTQVYAQSNETVETTANVDEAVQIPDEQVISVVADILHIQPETVVTLLEQLDLKPQKLTEPQNVTALLQEMYEAETPAVLLTEPGFPSQYKAINEAVAQLAKAHETVMQTLEQQSIAPQALTETATSLVPGSTNNESGQFINAETIQATNAETIQTAYPVNETTTHTTATTVASVSQTTTHTPALTESTAINIPTPEGLQYATENGQLVVTQTSPEEETNITTTRHTASFTSDTGQTPTANTETQPPTAETAPPPAAATVDPATVTAEPLANQIANRVQSVQITQQTQTAQAVNPADVINQIMSQIRVHTGEQVTEMRLTLRPESLGDIVLRVLTHNGIVTAQFIAESQRVREALESSFNQLRDALEEQGIRFSELSVSVRDNQDEQMNRFARGRQNARNRAANVTTIEEEAAPYTNIDFDSTINLTA